MRSTLVIAMYQNIDLSQGYETQLIEDCISQGDKALPHVAYAALSFMHSNILIAGTILCTEMSSFFGTLIVLTFAIIDSPFPVIFVLALIVGLSLVGSLRRLCRNCRI